MKPWIFALGFCLLTPIVSRADSRAFDEVPRDHWSISAAQQLLRWAGYQEILLTDRREPLTRYGLAVVTTRAIGKFGYNPVSKDSIDGLAVRDVLVAMVFEYGDEIRALSMATGGSADKAYRSYKESHKHLTASEWYTRFQEREWTKVNYEDLNRSKLENRVAPPPRLTITPTQLGITQPILAPEQARIAQEESLKNQWPQLPPGQ